MVQTQVECYAGTRYPERPRAFVWQGERLAVERVEREWRVPGGLAFLVRAADGRSFTLTYREAQDCWSIEASA
ncbi:MAG: hypothetical protein JXA74_15860 [Anaerolineae bacterium]|nr:hypothetical protein [Anaerolineae bacterium]